MGRKKKRKRLVFCKKCKKSPNYLNKVINRFWLSPKNFEDIFGQKQALFLALFMSKF